MCVVVVVVVVYKCAYCMCSVATDKLLDHTILHGKVTHAPTLAE